MTIRFWPVLLLTAWTSCHRATTSPATTPLPLSVGPAASTGSAPTAITPAPTSEADATLTIINEYPTMQYVFVDGTLVGSVASRTRATYAVDPGPHRIVCSDSTSREDNPTHLQGDFQPGYDHLYRLTME